MSKKTPAKGTLDKEYVITFFNKKNEILDYEAETDSKSIDEVTEKWNMNRRILRIYEKGMEEDQDLRKTYAKILIGILIFTLIVLIVVFILRGADVLKYSDTTFNIFVTGGIAEVFLLIKTIVKYLFKDNLTQPLNIILENNNKVRQKSNKMLFKNNANKNTTKS